MSLFDVIKYGNTDISNVDELAQLPNDIIELYFEMVRDDIWPARGEQRLQHHPLQINTRNGLMCLWARAEYGKYSQLFKSALLKYNTEEI